MPRLEGRLRSTDRAVEDALGDVDDAIDREPELLEDRPGRSARAEVVETDDRALVTDPAIPAHRHAGFDGDPRTHRRRQDGLAVGGVLELEPLPARHRHDPGGDPRP